MRDKSLNQCEKLYFRTNILIPNSIEIVGKIGKISIKFFFKLIKLKEIKKKKLREIKNQIKNLIYSVKSLNNEGITILSNFMGINSKILAETIVIKKELFMKVEINKLLNNDKDCFVIESYLQYSCTVCSSFLKPKLINVMIIVQTKLIMYSQDLSLYSSAH